MTEREWAECLRQMEENEREIDSWRPEMPNFAAKRCSESRHRTLGHLRACQETWLGACLAFNQEPEPKLTLLHPWTVFGSKSYGAVPWTDHMATFLSDRGLWKELLHSCDRDSSGWINGQEHSIESLTRRLVLHERRHLLEGRPSP